MTHSHGIFALKIDIFKMVSFCDWNSKINRNSALSYNHYQYSDPSNSIIDESLSPRLAYLRYRFFRNKHRVM